MNQEKSIKLKFWSLALVVFLLGGITGAALHALYSVRYGQNERLSGVVQSFTNSLPQFPPKPGPMTEMMKRELNLTDEQTVQIKLILDESRKEFIKIVKDECPGMKEVRDRTSERIRKVLTPEQQKKFDELEKQREAKMKAKEEKWQ